MRARASFTLLALLATGTTACTGGADGAGSASASSPPAPAVAPSVEQAQAAADAINLRSADVPGFASTPTEVQEPSAPDDDDALLACVGAGGDEGIVETASPTFSDGRFPRTEVSSNVDVYADPARAVRDVEAYQGERALQCLEDFFRESAAEGTPPGSAFSEPRVTRSTPAAPGTDAAVAFRIVATLSTQGQQVPVSFRLLAYAEDHTQVALIITQLGEGAPDVDVDALFAVLVSRAPEAV